MPSRTYLERRRRVNGKARLGVTLFAGRAP
jgi:hypothetical protein